MWCDAKTRSGERCKNRPVKGRDVCRMHGGKTPRGTASPHFRHGRYSKDLPSHLMERFEQALSDPDLVDLRRELALTDAEMSACLREMEKTPAREVWMHLHEAAAIFRRARSAGDLDEMTSSLELILGVIEQGIEAEKHWMKIDRLIERRRRLVESETRRELASSQELTYDSVTTLFAALTQAVRDSVPPKLAEEIRKKFDELTTRQDQPRLKLVN